MMMRGVADPLASAYCRLYMARCAESLNSGNRGKKFTITSIWVHESMLINFSTYPVMWETWTILKNYLTGS